MVALEEGFQMPSGLVGGKYAMGAFYEFTDKEVALIGCEAVGHGIHRKDSSYYDH